MVGGPLSDRWVRRNVRGRIYTSAIGLSMMIPALVCIGLGHDVYAAAGAALLFGVGYGMFDANNMPILCQFVPSHRRASAYGLMNMTGVFMGAAVTGLLGGLVSDGNLGVGFALMGGIVALAVVLQLYIAQAAIRQSGVKTRPADKFYGWLKDFDCSILMLAEEKSNNFCCRNVCTVQNLALPLHSLSR